MAKIASILEIHKNITEINFLPSELMSIIRSKNVLYYVKCIELCQDKFLDDTQKVGLCTLEQYCPTEYSKFLECKSKNKNNECYNEQIEVDKCIKKPINQLLNIFKKSKSY